MLNRTNKLPSFFLIDIFELESKCLTLNIHFRINANGDILFKKIKKYTLQNIHEIHG